MSPELYLTYLLACVVITTVPGPTVTLIIANSLSHGTRAGLLNVVGTQLGLGLLLAILAVGLSSIIATMGWWFDWLRLAGAAYLVWLGWKLFRAPAATDAPGGVPPRGGFVLQGFLVMLSNPKVLLFLGAFLPQFVDKNGDVPLQLTVLAVTFVIVVGLADAVYTVVLGKMRGLLASGCGRSPAASSACPCSSSLPCSA
jgi:threonine/homoserine/homoserine lactone efflux protein